MHRPSLAPASTDELRDLISRWRGRATPAYALAHDLCGAPESGDTSTVSVILTAFGAVNTVALRTVLKSISLQRSIRVDPILVEQVRGADPVLANLARDAGATHVVDRLPDGYAHGRWSLARARNAGIAGSRGAFLYFTDNDVVLADPGHLARLASIMREHPDLTITTPRSRHLLRERQAEACTHFLAHGSWDTGGLERIGNHALRWVGADHAHAADAAPEIVETVLDGIPCIARKADLDAYAADPQANRGREPSFWNLIVHHGTLMVRRRHLDVTGGYAECYVGWGVEDTDMVWKLAEMFLVLSAARLPDVSVVHLEHERGWFDPIVWHRNKLLSEDRRRRGVLEAVVADVLTGATPHAADLRRRYRWGPSGFPDPAPSASNAPY